MAGGDVMRDSPQATGGWVYLLTNGSMPGLVKIGMTTRSVDQRVKELSASTSLPTPFKVVHCWPVHDPAAVEAVLHKRLDVYRINHRREFFRVDTADIVQMMPRIIDEHGGLRPVPRRTSAKLLVMLVAVVLVLGVALVSPNSAFVAIGLFVLLFGLSKLGGGDRAPRKTKPKNRREYQIANRISRSAARRLTSYLLQGLLGSSKSRR